MSNIDKKFVDNLSDFTKSLEEIVKLLKEELKSSPTDGVTKMLEKMDGKLNTVVAELKAVREDTKAIRKDTGDILKAVKEMKSTKKDGISSDIGGKSTNTIAEGVKSMILIAGGVLAIGLAFNIVGKVDFLSVLALSAAIYVMALTFEKIAKIENLSYKKVLMVSLSMVIMAGAIAASGFLLNLVPNMNLMTMLSVFVVTAAMTIAFIGLSKAVHHLHMKDMWAYMLLPTILPLMAAGVVGAGYVLQNMPDVKWQQALAAGLVGLALVPVAIAFDLLVKGLKNTKATDILMACASIPMMALATVIAGYILQNMPEVKAETVLYAWAVSLAILPMAALIAGMSKFKVGIKELAFGSLGIIMISAAIMVSSLLLSIGNYEKYPSIDWSMGVGLSLLAFGAPVIGLGFLLSIPIGWYVLAMGILGILVLAGSIVAVSHILKAGDYSTYPPIEWSKSVGLSMLAFSASLLMVAVASPILALMKLFGDDPNKALEPVANSMISVAKILNQFNWATAKTPTKEWAEGAGLAVSFFAKSLVTIAAGQAGAAILNTITSLLGGENKMTLISVAQYMWQVAEELDKHDWEGSRAPTKEWAEGAGLAVSLFSQGLVTIAAGQAGAAILNTITSLLGGENKMTLISVAQYMWQVAEELDKHDWEGSRAPTKEWAEGAGTAISLFAKGLVAISASETVSSLGNIMSFGQNKKMTLVDVAYYMRAVANELNKQDWENAKAPGKEWAVVAPYTILQFIRIIGTMGQMASVMDIDLATSFLMKMGYAIFGFNVLMTKLDIKVFEKDGAITKIADSLEKLRKALPTGADTGGLMQLVGAMQMLSLIDEQRLAQVLTVINRKKEELRSIMDTGGYGSIMMEGFSNLLTNAGMTGPNAQRQTTTEIIAPKKEGKNEKDEKLDVLIDHVKNIDENIGKMTMSISASPLFGGKPGNFND